MEEKLIQVQLIAVINGVSTAAFFTKKAFRRLPLFNQRSKTLTRLMQPQETSDLLQRRVGSRFVIIPAVQNATVRKFWFFEQKIALHGVVVKDRNLNQSFFVATDGEEVDLSLISAVLHRN